MFTDICIHCLCQSASFAAHLTMSTLLLLLFLLLLLLLLLAVVVLLLLLLLFSCMTIIISNGNRTEWSTIRSVSYER